MRAILLVVVMAGVIGVPCAPGQESANRLREADDLVKSHRLDKANELLMDLVQQDPGNLQGLIKLGQVELALGLNDDALKSFERALSLDRTALEAREGEVKAAEAAALADSKAGIDGSALLYLMRARKFVPDSPELLLDFGVQAERMRIYRDADEALAKAHQLVPDNLKVLYALARVQLDEQKMPEAEVNLRLYLKSKPDDPTAHYGLGHLLHMMSRDDEAKNELDKSIALQPRQSASYYELGEIALEQNQDDAAREEFTRTLALAPHHGGALTGMGVLAFRAKDYPTAEQYLKSATEYAADYPKAHHYYALVLARLGRTEESKREAARATELDQQETKLIHGNTMTELQ
ncbi:MAG TPA: tetratricopeptide repeat protein [Terracidiphilus sp.]|jgi:tetratricopeptide (TPR) repeat protein